MKNGLLILISILFGLTAQANMCNDPLRQQDVCLNMRHLRSQILALGAQRDLMQVNYVFLAALGDEMDQVANSVKERIQLENPDHLIGLVTVQVLAQQMKAQALNKSFDALASANKIQNQCMTCHANDKPDSGYKWDDVFKSDWSAFYKKCNATDRNPYLCKSMHGMLSAYSNIFTSMQASRQNYNLILNSAREIERISGDLISKNIFHQGGESIIKSVNDRARETAELAEKEDPESMTRGFSITEACMQCHADRDRFVRTEIVINPFSSRR